MAKGNNQRSNKEVKKPKKEKPKTAVTTASPFAKSSSDGDGKKDK